MDPRVMHQIRVFSKGVEHAIIIINDGMSGKKSSS
jgi:hypothetical protein